jgi:cleavage stimulation factor subunit 3
VRHWAAYAEYECQCSNYTALEKIFSQCLRSHPHVSICKVYLKYIGRIHDPSRVPLEKQAEARTIITQAFEFVLGQVGFSKDAGDIWADYLAFIRSIEVIYWH